VVWNLSLETETTNRRQIDEGGKSVPVSLDTSMSNEMRREPLKAISDEPREVSQALGRPRDGSGNWAVATYE
jgi:hypothetical protein